MATSSTDRALLDACRRGDERAWRRLLDRYERLVWSIPLEYGLSQTDAADVTQATFAALLRSLDTISADAALASWLTTVTQRETWRHVARSRRETPTDATLDGLAGDDSEARVDRLQWLAQGLAELRPRCRELLTALYLSGTEPSYAELSAALGLPVGSIGPTRSRCLEQLQQALARLAAGEGTGHDSAPVVSNVPTSPHEPRERR